MLCVRSEFHRRDVHTSAQDRPRGTACRRNRRPPTDPTLVHGQRSKCPLSSQSFSIKLRNLATKTHAMDKAGRCKTGQNFRSVFETYVNADFGESGHYNPFLGNVHRVGSDGSRSIRATNAEKPVVRERLPEVPRPSLHSTLPAVCRSAHQSCRIVWPFCQTADPHSRIAPLSCRISHVSGRIADRAYRIVRLCAASTMRSQQRSNRQVLPTNRQRQE